MLVQERAPLERAHRWRWAALAALLLAEAMNLLDATVVTVAAPVIHADLGGAASGIQWFGAAYTLPFAVLLIPGGRLGDRAGRRRMFALGVAAFAVTSVACAFAGDPGTLIGLRAVQGAAAALVIPQTIGLIRAMFDGPDLTRAMGSIGPVMGLAAICGPVLGAALTHADLWGSSWRAAFLVNVPLAVVVLAALLALPGSRASRPPRLDLAGTVLAMTGTGLVVFPLIQGNTADWPVWAWCAPGAGVAVLVLFGFHQRRRARHGRSPLVEPSLFRGRAFAAALVTSTAFFAVVNGLMVVITLRVQLGLGQDVLTAGLTLLPWSGAMAIASWLAGSRLVPRYGSRVMFAGLAALALGLVTGIIAYGTASPWSLALCGIGNGLFTVPFFTSALARVRAHETGSAAGLLNAVQQFGGTLGIAVLGTVFLRVFAAATRARHAPGVAASDAMAWSCWVALALVVVTAVAATLMAVGDRWMSISATRRPRLPAAR